MFKFGPWELFLVLLIILLLFGAKKLPEISRALGRSLKEFKKGCKEVNDQIEDAASEKENNKDADKK